MAAPAAADLNAGDEAAQAIAQVKIDASPGLEPLLEQLQQYVHDTADAVTGLLVGAVDDKEEIKRFEPLLDELRLSASSFKQPCVGFVGRRGTGKTTLLNTILKYDLLPVGEHAPATAVLTEAVAWPDAADDANKGFLAMIHFITLPEWKELVDEASTDMKSIREARAAKEVIELDSLEAHESYPYLHLLATSLHAMWSDVDKGRSTALMQEDGNGSCAFELQDAERLVPDAYAKAMRAGYLSINNKDSAAFAQELEQYASADAGAWPLVYKITLYGPFEFLRAAQISMLDVPGSGDQDAIRSRRFEQGLDMCDRIFYLPESKQKASGATCEAIQQLSRKHHAPLSVIITHCNGYGNRRGANILTCQQAEAFYRGELLRNLMLPALRAFIQQLPVFFVENDPDKPKARAAYRSHFEDLLERGLRTPSKEDLDSTLVHFVQDINHSTFLLRQVMSMDRNQHAKVVDMGKALPPFPKLDAQAALQPLQHTMVANDLIDMVVANTQWPSTDTHYSTLKSIFHKHSRRIPESRVRHLCKPIAAALVHFIPVTDVSARIQQLLTENKVKVKAYLAELAKGLQLDDVRTATLTQPFDAIQYINTDLQTAGGIAAEFEAQLLAEHAAAWSLIYDQTGATKESLAGGARQWLTNSMAGIMDKAWSLVGTFLANTVNMLSKQVSERVNATVAKLLVKPEQLLKVKDQLLNLIPILSTKTVADGTFFAALISPTPPAAGPAAALPLAAAVNPGAGLSPLATCLAHLAQLVGQHPLLLHAPTPHDVARLERKRGMRSTAGVIYVMSNESYKDNVHKIGLTKNAAHVRAKQLRTTAVPTPFKVENTYNTQHTTYHELYMHIMFSSVRIRLEREFFRVPLDLIQQVAEVVTDIVSLQLAADAHAVPLH